MREAIGGTWLFQIVIVFILLFTGFMCLTINRSKAFNVKNEIVQTIQTYNGINLNEECIDSDTDSEICSIVKYLTASSYRTTGVDPADTYSYTCFTRDGKRVAGSEKPVFCIAQVNVASEGCANSGASTSKTCFDELPSMYYYRVIVFYQLDLPVFHDLFNFKVVGETKTLYGAAK